ncbi:uncharacterized protein TNCV_529881 [Trichonephila clavipes]|nr:uncharacterized protein TNCV_529881 [Trichonephila clavipes]
MAEEKRKIDDECRQFQEWSLKYFLIKSGEKALCMICNVTVAVLKENNLRRHHRYKDQEKYAQLEGKVRAEKFSELQNQLTFQRTVNPQMKKDPELRSVIKLPTSHRGQFSRSGSRKLFYGFKVSA